MSAPTAWLTITFRSDAGAAPQLAEWLDEAGALAVTMHDAADAPARECAESEYWPGRYRLDALMPEAGRVLNLSHLLLGHGGDLAWVDWMVFEALRDPVSPPVLKDWGKQAGEPGDHWYTAQGLDLQIKGMFDPCGIFPHPGQDL